MDCYVYSPLYQTSVAYRLNRPFGKQGLSNVEIIRLPPTRSGFDIVKLVVGDSHLFSSFSKGQSSMFSYFFQFHGLLKNQHFQVPIRTENR